MYVVLGQPTWQVCPGQSLTYDKPRCWQPDTTLTTSSPQYFFKVLYAAYDPSRYYINGGNMIPKGQGNDVGVLILESAANNVITSSNTSFALPLLNYPGLPGPWVTQYKQASDLPNQTVTTSGYGIMYNGDTNKGGVGQPVATYPASGPTKTTVSLHVLSLEIGTINAQMVLRQGDPTLCNGDSGSGALIQWTAPATGQPWWVILGVVVDGDQQCRSTNRYDRIDTVWFLQLLQQVAAGLQQVAASQG